MGLTPEQIKQLLAKPERRAGGVRKGIDTNVRDYQTWFAIAHKMLNGETGELADCDNPNCSDPRRAAGKKSIMVVEIKGQKCCRHCFMDGWLRDNPSQLTLT